VTWLFGSFRLFFGMALVIWCATQSRRWGWTFLDEGNASSAFWATFLVLPALAGLADALLGKSTKNARVSCLCALAGCILFVASRPEVGSGMALVVVAISGIASFLVQVIHRICRRARR
jgi:hypothetical protein